MRDSFVGDIGDFSNNGLLRILCGTPENPVDRVRLAVISYYNNGPAGPDGNHIEYLNCSVSNDCSYRECDRELYDIFQELVGASIATRRRRTIFDTEQLQILPTNTYFNTPLNDGPTREQWHDAAVGAVEAPSFVFVNPDKGIAYRKSFNGVELQEDSESAEHTSMRELRDFYRGGNSLLIYQHLPRNLKKACTNAWLGGFANRLQLGLKAEFGVTSILWHRVSRRAYFVVPSTEDHQDVIDNQLQVLRGSPWMRKDHFTIV